MKFALLLKQCIILVAVAIDRLTSDLSSDVKTYISAGWTNPQQSSTTTNCWEQIEYLVVSNILTTFCSLCFQRLVGVDEETAFRPTRVQAWANARVKFSLSTPKSTVSPRETSQTLNHNGFSILPLEDYPTLRRRKGCCDSHLPFSTEPGYSSWKHAKMHICLVHDPFRNSHVCRISFGHDQCCPAGWVGSHASTLTPLDQLIEEISLLHRCLAGSTSGIN